MNKQTLLFLLFLIATLHAKSQILPKENSILHYRLIGFSFPLKQNISKYTLEIAEGNYHDDKTFKINILKTQSSATNKLIAEVPSFGKEYTWRISYTANGAPSGSSDLYHFSTGTIPELETNNFRFRITKQAEQNKDAYVFLDANKALYDMKGNMIWYLPDIEGYDHASLQIRDMKLTPYGTITFLYNFKIYEISYDGSVLWKGPDNGIVSGDTVEHYHHDLTRLANGHYMTLGTEYLPWQRDTAFFNSRRIQHAPNRTPAAVKPEIKIPSGTIIEYDEKGNVVWSWKSSKYFIGSDLVHYINPDGGSMVEAHENAFSFDEKEKVIYVSFKNISRVLKLKYPEGIILNTYGEIYKPGIPSTGNGMFCYQHSCKHEQRNSFYLFNNNGCNPECGPEVILLQDVPGYKDSLHIAWLYECPVIVSNRSKQRRDGKRRDNMSTGGNVEVLRNGSVFISTCTPYGSMFIVDKQKNILWSGIAEKRNLTENKWEDYPQYRSSLIQSRNELEQLIRASSNNR